MLFSPNGNLVIYTKNGGFKWGSHNNLKIPLELKKVKMKTDGTYYWTFWFHADVTQKKNTDLRGKFCVISVIFICVTSARKMSSSVASMPWFVPSRTMLQTQFNRASGV